MAGEKVVLLNALSLAFLFCVFGKPDNDNINKNNGISIKSGMPEITIILERLQILGLANKTKDVTFVNSRNRVRTGRRRHGHRGIKDKKDWVQMNVTYSEKLPNTILGHPVDRYTVNCTAPYLTRWSSSIVPRLPAKYGHANRYNHDPFQQDSSRMVYESQISIMLPNGTSGFLQCESVKNSTVATKVYIYAQDGDPFASNNQKSDFEPPIITDTRKDFIVPCRANYPDLSVTLTKVIDYSSGREEVISPSERIGGYDPQVGFHLKGNKNSDQRYRCKTGSNRKRSDTITYNFYNPDLHENSSNSTVQFFIGAQGDEFPLGIWCKTGQEILNQIKIITCDSQYECDWLNDCFYDKCTGNEILRKSAIPYQPDKSNVKSKGTITNPFTRGKVICVSANNSGSVAYEYLFTGLDRHRYWLVSQENEIPKTAIIYMNETSPVLYSNKPAAFACETSNFLLLSNIKFAALFKNGSNILLDKINATSDPAILVDNDLGFSRKEILVNLTTDMVGILCLAPWLNSSDWINTSRKFEVRDVLAPSVQSTSNNTDTFTFFIGDKSRSLFCPLIGEPQPEIKWTVPEEVYQKFVNLNKEEATLHFPILDSSFAGTYKCTGTNNYGTNDFNFIVGVKEPSHGLSTEVILAIITTFIVLIIGLGVSTFKYINAKKRIRDLTKEEIDEFYYGRLINEDDDETISNIPQQDPVAVEIPLADLLKDIRQQDAANVVTEDQIQSMKFDRRYEILPSNLQIEESLILGQGEFGKVTKGTFKGEAVAVKTTKPKADVIYIKALLSEIKIMQYIAKWSHPNILRFIGAEISDMKKGKVFLVFELSPLGDLESFLKKLGPSFTDLLNEGTLSLGGKSYDQVKKEISILNLVSWCEQIAAAMDFLTCKRIIHADLATRNVLRFHNDVVKVTDFGLARRLYTSPLYRKKIGSHDEVKLPVPWMAIESLQFLQFSSYSDVWSFGVTAWEIFSLCQVPLIGVDFQSAIKLLLDGRRLKKPPFALENIYSKLLECWKLDPEERPTFGALRDFFGLTLRHIKDILETEAANQLSKSTPDEAASHQPSSSGYVTYGVGI